LMYFTQLVIVSSCVDNVLARIATEPNQTLSQFIKVNMNDCIVNTLLDGCIYLTVNPSCGLDYLEAKNPAE